MDHRVWYSTVQVGTIMAASDRFNITVLGRGGHAGLPHKAQDPVVAAAALVGALQVRRSGKPQRRYHLEYFIEVTPSMLMGRYPTGGRRGQGMGVLTGLLRLHFKLLEEVFGPSVLTLTLHNLQAVGMQPDQMGGFPIADAGVSRDGANRWRRGGRLALQHRSVLRREIHPDADAMSCLENVVFSASCSALSLPQAACL